MSCREGVCADEGEGAPAEAEAPALRVNDPLMEPLPEAEGDREGAPGVPVPQGEGDKVRVSMPLALGQGDVAGAGEVGHLLFLLCSQLLTGHQPQSGLRRLGHSPALS